MKSLREKYSFLLTIELVGMILKLNRYYENKIKIEKLLIDYFSSILPPTPPFPLFAIYLMTNDNNDMNESSSFGFDAKVKMIK